MQILYHDFQIVLLLVCLSGLGATLAAISLRHALVPLWDCMRRWASLPRIQQALLAFCVVGLIHYGATKSKITFDGGIKDGFPASYTTNDEVHVTWVRDMSGGVYVPDTAAVYIDYRPNTETNGDWGLLAQSVVGDGHWFGTLEGATNYDFNVWAYYIPPEPVHTNGVWVYKTLKDRAGKYPIPLRARIEINGKAIATPAEKRKDER